MQTGLPVRLLGLLAEGGIRSLAELARRLDVSEDLARLITEDLTRRGYLAALGGDCATACAGCALSKACGTHGAHTSKPSLLALTATGRQAVANDRGLPRQSEGVDDRHRGSNGSGSVNRP